MSFWWKKRGEMCRLCKQLADAVLEINIPIAQCLMPWRHRSTHMQLQGVLHGPGAAAVSHCSPVPHLQSELEDGALISASPEQLHVAHRLALCGGTVRYCIWALARILQHSIAQHSTRTQHCQPTHQHNCSYTAQSNIPCCNPAISQASQVEVRSCRNL